MGHLFIFERTLFNVNGTKTMLSVKQKIIVLVGPTASGKSDLGVVLAKKFGGEIISADSRQVYRGLDIGSGKITKQEMRGGPHFCLDIVSPKKVFTAKEYMRCANTAIAAIGAKKKVPIMVGGTGFYIDAALGNIPLADVAPNPALRQKLAKKSVAQLFAMLKKLDPKRARTIDAKNPMRLIRAIEIYWGNQCTPLTHSRRASARLRGFRAFLPLASLGDRAKKGEKSVHGVIGSPLHILWIGMGRSPEELKKRIGRRLTQRLPGIIREVKRLHHLGEVSWKRLYDLGLEYRFVSLYLRGKLSETDMKAQLETAIRHYAKRQMTWFRRNKKIHWISNKKNAEKLVQKFLKKK